MDAGGDAQGLECLASAKVQANGVQGAVLAQVPQSGCGMQTPAVSRLDLPGGGGLDVAASNGAVTAVELKGDGLQAVAEGDAADADALVAVVVIADGKVDFGVRLSALGRRAFAAVWGDLVEQLPDGRRRVELFAYGLTDGVGLRLLARLAVHQHQVDEFFGKSGFDTRVLCWRRGLCLDREDPKHDTGQEQAGSQQPGHEVVEALSR